MSESERRDTPEQAEFREYAINWLQANKPGEPPVRLPQTPLEIMPRDQLNYLQAWQKAANLIELARSSQRNGRPVSADGQTGSDGTHERSGYYPQLLLRPHLVLGRPAPGYIHGAGTCRGDESGEMGPGLRPAF